MSNTSISAMVSSTKLMDEFQKDIEDACNMVENCHDKTFDEIECYTPGIELTLPANTPRIKHMAHELAKIYALPIRILSPNPTSK